MASSGLKKILIDLETTLLSSAPRKSGEILEDLLHDQFLEIGSSGRKYDKHQTIQQLGMESRTPAEATDFSLLQISDSVALLTYTLVNKIQDSNSTYSVRSSIWKLENDKWKLVFHQGTHTGLG